MCGSRSSETVHVCAGKSCVRDGAKYTSAALRALLNSDKVQECGCLGECGNGPNVLIRKHIQRGVRSEALILELAMNSGQEMNLFAKQALQHAQEGKRMARSDSQKALLEFKQGIAALERGLEENTDSDFGLLLSILLSNSATLLLELGRIVSTPFFSSHP